MPRKGGTVRSLPRGGDLNISSTAPHFGAPSDPGHAGPPNRNRRELMLAVKAVNQAGLFGQNELTFVIDPKTRRTVVRIVNRETREVVDQIPEKYVLDLAEEIKGR
jgi:uncharacterized FlaG/YvyC family protein